MERKGSRKHALEHCTLCRFGEDDPLISYEDFHVHHIDERAVAKSEGRKINNHPSNLVNLCPICHTLLHNKKIEIDRYYLSTGGMMIRWKNKEGIWDFTGI